MENYDEDLTENPFFQVLQNEHGELFRRATSEGWIICVPRTGSVPKYALSHEDFFCHILIPSDELPESHFRSLNDKDVRILNRVITVEQQDIARPYVTHILFEETFYTDEIRYKVLCIESPLEKLSNVILGQNDAVDLVSINTLRDSIDLLWTESAGHNVLEKIDQCVKSFLQCYEGLEFEPLGAQKDLVGKLYTQCLQVALSDSRLRERTSADRHLLDKVKLSVETYMHHGIYKKLFEGVTACTAYEDSQLNKIIRNLSDIQLRDLEIRSDLYCAVPWAKQELARIDSYSTVLGKIGCLKRMLVSISQQNEGRNKDTDINHAISADDLLPVIVFLVMKTGTPNWVANLTYIKQFHFSSSVTTGVDEHSFLITSLEAAIEHIKSGILLGPSDPEGYVEQSDVTVSPLCLSLSNSKAEKNSNTLPTSGIRFFFNQVRLGNLDTVKDILQKKRKNDKEEGAEKNTALLCHPLCSCDKCESMLSVQLCDTTPTINSCDDRGFTALHVACLFGRPEMVDLLITSGANVDATDYSSSTPLHYACAKGHQNAVLLLLHSSCTIDVRDSDGNTPLHFASNNGHEGCVKALLYFAEHVDVHINVNCTNSNGDTPLHHASRWGYEGIVQILLDYGAWSDVENKRHLSPIDYAHNLHILNALKRAVNKNKNSFTVISFNGDIYYGSKKDSDNATTSDKQNTALDFDEDVNSSFATSSKKNFLAPESADQIKLVEKMLRAIAHGDIRLACYYLGLDGPWGGEKNLMDDVKSFCHPLCTCVKCRPSEEKETSEKSYSKRKLLNVNVCNNEGFTPLHVAAMHGQSDMVRLLLDAGAETNLVTRSKSSTPLHLACQNQRVSVVEILLQTNNCEVNMQDFRGNTPLHYACYTGSTKLVKMILKCSPLLNLKNVRGKTALQEAEDNLSLTVVALIKRCSSVYSSSSTEDIFTDLKFE